jgi:hypothetical protein
VQELNIWDANSRSVHFRFDALKNMQPYPKKIDYLEEPLPGEYNSASKDINSLHHSPFQDKRKSLVPDSDSRRFNTELKSKNLHRKKYSVDGYFGETGKNQMVNFNGFGTIAKGQHALDKLAAGPSSGNGATLDTKLRNIYVTKEDAQGFNPYDPLPSKETGIGGNRLFQSTKIINGQPDLLNANQFDRDSPDKIRERNNNRLKLLSNDYKDRLHIAIR